MAGLLLIWLLALISLSQLSLAIVAAWKTLISSIFVICAVTLAGASLQTAPRKAHLALYLAFVLGPESLGKDPPRIGVGEASICLKDTCPTPEILGATASEGRFLRFSAELHQ